MHETVHKYIKASNYFSKQKLFIVHFKENQISNLLGENTRLEETAKELEGRIVALAQINASLREDLNLVNLLKT